MTVIAWDGKKLAADKQSTAGGLKSKVTKLWRVGAAIVGGSGDTVRCEEIVAWLRNGGDPASFPKPRSDMEAKILMITPDGKICLFEESPYPMTIEDGFTAIGSGRDFATAAMYLGCDAAQAVAVACQFDAGCGMGVDVLELPGADEERQVDHAS
jgi:20S proteasome alpha/beta subunit